MKINSVPACVLGLVTLASLIAGCDPQKSPEAGASPAAATRPAGEAMGPSAPPATAAPDNTAVPDTTMIDGKTVSLKKTASGLRYYDIKAGTGAMPKDGQTVTVNYIGKLMDGTKFDASYDRNEPFDFSIGQGRVIPGWDEGVATMKIGGKRRLVVPGDLAYGPSAPSPAIPANATLVFDVDLIDAK